MESLSCIARNIKDRDFFCILIHDYPDGDAIGSAVALCRALQNIGKNAFIQIPRTLPKKFHYLTRYINFQNFIPQVFISVDLASTSLLPEDLKKYENKIDICIDHHKSNNMFAKMNFIDSNSAANCEIMFDLLNCMNCPIDEKIAECLYIGIATDTGGFMYSSTSYRTHNIVSQLLRKNVPHSDINEKLFLTKSIKRIETEKLIYSNMRILFDKLVVSYITLDEINKLSITDDELDGIPSIPISIEGMEVGILLTEKSYGLYKASVRTRKKIDANQFCQKFGGGGHLRAGGFTVKMSLDAILDRIFRIVKEDYGENL